MNDQRYYARVKPFSSCRRRGKNGGQNRVLISIIRIKMADKTGNEFL